MTKIDKAIQYAVSAHAGTNRKGKQRPYILHPIEAMTIVAGMTDDEDIISAAVLHDVMEDTGKSEADIREAFGDRVADLVMAESEDKKPEIPSAASWETRKQATIDHLRIIGRDAQMICLGDKLANIREMRRDLDACGDALWERFNQKDKSKHGWYYGSLFRVLEEVFGDIPEIREYRELLEYVFG